MRIWKIFILNFGPYCGSHTLEFHNEGAGIHLIRGGNGQGKTSIQNAVLWCLFGTVKNRKGKDIPLSSLLNRTAKKNGDNKVTIKINFNHEEKDSEITRSMTSRKQKPTQKRLKDSMMTIYNKEGDILSEVEKEIERIITPQVSRFYFFDGEMLRDYEELLDPGGSLLLKNSIERVLGVPHLKKAKDDLEQIMGKFGRERNKLLKSKGGDELEDLAEQSEQCDGRIQDLKRTIKKHEKQQEELVSNIKDSKRELENIKETRDMAQKRNRIEADIELLKANKETNEHKQGDFVKDLYKNVLSPLAQSLIDQLEIKSERVNDKFRKKQFAVKTKKDLEGAISNSKCSQCGHELDSEKTREFEKQLSEVKLEIKELTEVPEPNPAYENSKSYLEKMMESRVSVEDIRKIDEEINNQNYNLARLDSELARVKEILKDVDAEEPNRLENLIQTEERESGRLNGIIETKNEELLALMAQKDDLDRRIRRLPNEELKLLTRRVEFTRRLTDVFGRAVSRFTQDQKKKVESDAIDIFKVIRSKEDFDRLSINENYGLSIVTKDGIKLDRSEWRSSGEEQMVALSLIGALNKCANVQAPIFMDTPFGRLDRQHGERVLRYLPEMSKQLVLFVTDRELLEGDEKHLGDISTDLTLEHKNEREGSFISTTRAGL